MCSQYENNPMPLLSAVLNLVLKTRCTFEPSPIYFRGVIFAPLVVTSVSGNGKLNTDTTPDASLGGILDLSALLMAACRDPLPSPSPS